MEATGGVDRGRWVLEAVDQFEVRLLRFAARLLGDEDAARDAVQQAFLRLCSQSAERLNGREGPWLFAVCRHVAIDVLRKRETRGRPTRSRRPIAAIESLTPPRPPNRPTCIARSTGSWTNSLWPSARPFRSGPRGLLTSRLPK